MAEAQVLSDFADKKMQTAQPEQFENKLPRIQHPFSRGNVRSKAEKRKTPPLLPFIKHSVSNLPGDGELGTPSKTSPEIQKDDFALQIEQKLKMVLENVNQGEDVQEEVDDNDDMDFEQIINQNREKLKLQKQKIDSRIHPNNLMDSKDERKENKTKSKTIKTSNKHDNLYEKRMKQYRDAASQNKYLQKKKQIIAQKNEAIQRAKQALKVKDEGVSSKTTSIPIQPPLQKNPLRPKFSAKEERNQTKISEEGSKTANLFDNIHNLLQNPHKNRAASEMKRMSKMNIQSLEDKIKVINEKLGVNETKFNEQNGGIEQKTVLDWKRIEYTKGNNFRCYYDSNFEKQIDKIGSLQDRNANYLNKFIDHQKTLVELTLLKKMHTKGEQKTT